MSEDHEQRAGGEVPPQPAAGASPPTRSKGEPVPIREAIAEALAPLDPPRDRRRELEELLGRIDWERYQEEAAKVDLTGLTPREAGRALARATRVAQGVGDELTHPAIVAHVLDLVRRP